MLILPLWILQLPSMTSEAQVLGVATAFIVLFLLLMQLVTIDYQPLQSLVATAALVLTMPLLTCLAPI